MQMDSCHQTDAADRSTAQQATLCYEAVYWPGRMKTRLCHARGTEYDHKLSARGKAALMCWHGSAYGRPWQTSDKQQGNQPDGKALVHSHCCSCCWWYWAISCWIALARHAALLLARSAIAVRSRSMSRSLACKLSRISTIILCLGPHQQKPALHDRWPEQIS